MSCAHVPLCTRRLKIPSHLRTLSEFLRVSAGCSKKQPVFLYAKIFSFLVLTLSTLLSAIFVVIIFCARVLICTRRLKIPSHLRTLSEFLRVSAGCSNKQPVFLYAKIFYLLVLTLSTLLSEPLWRGSRRRRDFLPFTRCGKQRWLRGQVPQPLSRPYRLCQR